MVVPDRLLHADGPLTWRSLKRIAERLLDHLLRVGVTLLDVPIHETCTS